MIEKRNVNQLKVNARVIEFLSDKFSAKEKSARKNAGNVAIFRYKNLACVDFSKVDRQQKWVIAFDKNTAIIKSTFSNLDNHSQELLDSDLEYLTKLFGENAEIAKEHFLKNRVTEIQSLIFEIKELNFDFCRQALFALKNFNLKSDPYELATVIMYRFMCLKWLYPQKFVGRLDEEDVQKVLLDGFRKTSIADLPVLRNAQIDFKQSSVVACIYKFLSGYNSAINDLAGDQFIEKSIPLYTLCYIFEGLIEGSKLSISKVVNRDSRKQNGVFYTPPYLADFVTQSVLERLSKKSPHICDPAMGSGIFLLSAAYAIVRNSNKNRLAVLSNLYGIDINDRAVDLTRTILICFAGGKTSHSALCKQIVLDDSLQKFPNALEKIFRRKIGFDAILGNPPWGSSIQSEIYEKFSACRPYYNSKVKNSFKLFYFSAKTLLTKSGVLGYVVPSTSLLQEDYEDVRKEILEKFGAGLLVDLGTSVFKDATVQTSVHILDPRSSGLSGFEIREVKSEYKRVRLLFETSNFEPIRVMTFNGNVRFLFNSPETVEKFSLLNTKSSNLHPLSKYVDEVTKGVEPGCVEAFLVDPSAFKSKDFLYPILEGKDVSPSKIHLPRKAVIKLNGIDESKIPLEIKNHLLRYSAELKNRSKVKSGAIKWYELNNAKSADLFRKKSILIRRTSDTIIHAKNKGFWTTNGVHVLTLRPEYAHLLDTLDRVLSSELVKETYQEITQEKGKTFAEVKGINLLKLPVPDLEILERVSKKTTRIEDAIIKIVEPRSRKKAA